jgi:type IV secretory pathway VirB10-like protein
MVLAALTLAGCDKPPPRAEKKLPIPQGENTLDDLIKKAQSQPPPAPPAPGRLEVDPAMLDFSMVTVGESASRQVRVTNAGEVAIALRQLRIAGQASMFRLEGTCVVGGELAAGHSCVADVRFRPMREGPADAELVVDHSGAGGTAFVTLTGEGKGRQPEVQAALAPNAQASLVFARSRQDAGLAVNGDASASASAAAPKGDYAEAGLPGIVSTFPVDRTRVITADRYIPAILENTISSQLPGRAIAVVERNVYGSEGRTVLIPAGSRVIGRYQSLAKAGDARLDINWWRIIRPDGANINIDDQSADVMGRAGVPGDLDTRFFEKYGSSLLTSVIAAGGEWALGGDSTTVNGALGGTTQTMSNRARAANRLGNDLDQLGVRMVQENVDIRPVLTVAQGTRLDIIPAEDIWLRDPNRVQAVTPPKTKDLKTAMGKTDSLAQLIPGLVELLAQNPSVQKAAPQTAQQVMQSAILQQLRTGNYGLPGSGDAATTSSGGGNDAKGQRQ